MSAYTKVVSRKRTWTPVAVDKGQVKEGSEETLLRCLALRTLELPVKEMLAQGLEKELPDDPGVIPALRSNMQDEDKHDRALEYIINVHGTDSRAEREAERIRQAWLSHPAHPILKTAILERSVFFVLLPFFRFNGDMGIRTTASDISRDEQTHVAIHAMVAHDLGLKPSESLNKLRKATIHWAMDLLGKSEDKYLDKDSLLRASDQLYYNGKTDTFADTRRARMPAFFEASNVNLPQYG